MTNPSKSLTFFVAGLPAPQGSKRHVGKGVMVESSKAVEPWRQDVRKAAADAADGVVFSGPTAMTISFYLPGLSSDPHRYYHATRPDIDKLARSTLDAIVSAGVLKDDSLVWALTLAKRHAVGGQLPGAEVCLFDDTEAATHIRRNGMLAAAQARKATR